MRVFESVRVAVGWAIAKRSNKKRGRTLFAERVQAAWRETSSEANAIRRTIYGQGGDSLGIERGEEADGLLYAWATKDCPSCGGYAPLEGAADHVCHGGPFEGHLFWTPRRIRVLRAVERRLLRRFRSLGVVKPRERVRGHLVQRDGELEVLAPAGGELPRQPLRALEDDDGVA